MNKIAIHYIGYDILNRVQEGVTVVGIPKNAEITFELLGNILEALLTKFEVLQSISYKYVVKLY